MDMPARAASADSTAAIQRLAALHAAGMTFASLLVGCGAGLAFSGALALDARMLLAAHLTGLMGAFFNVAVAWTVPMLSFSDGGRRRLVLTIVVANWANLLVGTAKTFPAVHGVGLTGNVTNNVVFGLLTSLVVLPTLVASAAWCFGLRRRSDERTTRGTRG
jgi:hypothetical protein